MTSKDYRLIAEALHKAKPIDSPVLGIAIATWEDTVLSISKALLQQNPRFKETMFLKACNEGISKEK